MWIAYNSTFKFYLYKGIDDLKLKKFKRILRDGWCSKIYGFGGYISIDDRDYKGEGLFWTIRNLIICIFFI